MIYKIFKYVNKYFFEVIYLFFLGCFNAVYSFYLGMRDFRVLIFSNKLFWINNFINFYYKTNYSHYKNIKEKESLDKKPMELTYGETPFITLQRVFKEIPFSNTSTFYDLGCGRGKVVFFVNLLYKIRAFGVDIMPTYVHVANSVVKRYKLNNIKFFLDDILEHDFSKGDIFYICMTCFEEQTQKKLFEKLEKINKEIYVITASNAIKSEKFEMVKKLKVLYSWGLGTLYINKSKV